MGTYESEVTSCSMIACGKIGANASGPTGSLVAGFRGGSRPKGRSGTRLYQLSGMAFSSSKNFVVSTVLALSSCLQLGYQLTAFGVRGLRTKLQGRRRKTWARREVRPQGPGKAIWGYPCLVILCPKSAGTPTCCWLPIYASSASRSLPRVCWVALASSGTSDHPNLTASKGITISQAAKSTSTAATNNLSQSGCPLYIGADIRSARNSGFSRASHTTSESAKPKKSTMNAHPAGQSNVPAEMKSSAANTANSASTSRSALPKSALRFIGHLH